MDQRHSKPTEAQLAAAINDIATFCEQFCGMNEIEGFVPNSVLETYAMCMDLLQANPRRTRKLFLEGSFATADECANLLWHLLQTPDEPLCQEWTALYGFGGSPIPATHADVAELLIEECERRGLAPELQRILMLDVAEVKASPTANA